MAKRSRHQRVFLEPINYDAEFIVLRDFPLKGVTQRKNSPFDKGLVSKRVLRLFYESRLLMMKEGSYSKRPLPRIYRPTEVVRLRVGTDKKTGIHKYGLFQNGVRIDGEPAPLPAPVEDTQDSMPPADTPPEPPVALETPLARHRPRVRINKVEDKERLPP